MQELFLMQKHYSAVQYCIARETQVTKMWGSRTLNIKGSGHMSCSELIQIIHHTKYTIQDVLNCFPSLSHKMVFHISWLCVSLTCLVISIFKLNHNWMAIVGDVERCTWFIGDNKWLQIRVINCSCRNYINRWLAVPLGNRVRFVPLWRSFKRKERKAPLFCSYYTQDNHYRFSWDLK